MGQFAPSLGGGGEVGKRPFSDTVKAAYVDTLFRSLIEVVLQC